jgi:hypothetical protein
MSTSTQLREILYTDSQDMLVLSSTVTTTTAVQVAASVPEVMDTPSYYAGGFSARS